MRWRHWIELQELNALDFFVLRSLLDVSTNLTGESPDAKSVARLHGLSGSRAGRCRLLPKERGVCGVSHDNTSISLRTNKRCATVRRHLVVSWTLPRCQDDDTIAGLTRKAGETHASSRQDFLAVCKQEIHRRCNQPSHSLSQTERTLGGRRPSTKP